MHNMNSPMRLDGNKSSPTQRALTLVSRKTHKCRTTFQLGTNNSLPQLHFLTYPIPCQKTTTKIKQNYRGTTLKTKQKLLGNTMKILGTHYHLLTVECL